MSMCRVLPFLPAPFRLPTRRPSHARRCALARNVGKGLLGALLTSAAMLAHAQAPASPQSGLPTTELTAGIHVIRAEVASTDATRSTGLMYRKTLPVNGGMLFVFDMTEMQCFWMRNTPLPLSIAFIADDGTIVNIADMAPQSDDTHCSTRPVRYALEMNQGWFESRGVKPGQRISGLSR